MIKLTLKTVFVSFAAMALAVGCKDQNHDDHRTDIDAIPIGTISEDMAKVRDYVPPFAVIAHRGSTFWTPEETESAYRWARDMGVDYLECDMQVSKDGVILALHDDNLSRTTNIEAVFGQSFPTEIRRQYYLDLGYTDAEAEAKIVYDRERFIPHLTNFYTFQELQMLDAGSWFNAANPNQARLGFAFEQQYVSALEDLINFARGNRLERDPVNGERIIRSMTRTNRTIEGLSGVSDVVEYELAYVPDDVATSNRPGIYIEFKEPWLNPKGFEQMVYDELDRLGMNIITAPEPENAEPYIDETVNVGNTNGKVILQTFSLESLRQVSEVFQGKVPMCWLLWYGTGATDLKYPTPLGYASYIDLGLQYKAHIIGPSIGGAPNNYPDLNEPWMAYLIRKAGMLNHPYSFDTRAQMDQYYGAFNFGQTEGVFTPPYLDAMFTNRSEMTLQYFIDKGHRQLPAPQDVPNASELLDRLGYFR